MLPKKIHANSVLGQRGVNLIENMVLRMGFFWYPTGGIEAGIDGIIEIRDSMSGVVTNAIIQVQSKATSGPFTAETALSFEYLCRERDLDYWLQGNAPVILVVSRPDTNEAYWVSIKDYFSDLAKRQGRRVTFDKARNKFDETARAALSQLAVPKDAGIYFAPPPKKEQLYSNLLAVSSMADRIYVAQTECRDVGEVWSALRGGGNIIGGEWILKSKQIFSFYDLTDSCWANICDQGTIEDFITSEWANSTDVGTRRAFVYLLNHCLRQMTRGLGLRYDKDLGCYYFRATDRLNPRKIGYHSLNKDTFRTVFQAYSSKKEPDKIAFYRHSAFEGRFRRYDNAWFLEVTPTYYFTKDGYELDPFYEDKLKGIKRLERNPAVLGQVLMWASYLSQPSGLFSTPYPFLQLGELHTFETDVGIDDEQWLRDEDDMRAMQSSGDDTLWGIA